MPISDLAPVLRRSALFRPLRNAYLRTFKPGYWKANVRGLCEFYSQFVKPDCLVFDIGANVGTYSEVFLRLGARVVAVEPVPAAFRKLCTIRNKRLTALPCAIGAAEGTLLMHINQVTDFSTLSSQWADIASQVERFKNSAFIDTVNVPVRTLDSLMHEFGWPTFIKIDVEGFELEVLKGMRRMPHCLSFEFNSEWLAPTYECLRQPCFPPGTRFNVLPGGKSFALQEWVTAEELGKLDLSSHVAGEIFAIESFSSPAVG